MRGRRGNVTRREFVKRSLVVSAVVGAGWLAKSIAAERDGQGGPRRELGRTGEKISAIGLGGYHIGNPPEAEAIRIIRTAIDGGITFMDNCWDYHNGESEVRMGKALREGYRDKVFLMTKIDGRTAAAAAKQIDESLQRLQTDRVDLMQIHEVIRMEDADRVFARGGAIEALVAARKAGKIRFIGFTGHKDPAIHLRMLEMAAQNGFRYDAVQMPLNVLDAHFRSFQHQVLPVLLKENIGVLGMKPLASGNALRTGKVSAIECLQYALSLPTSTVITGVDRVGLLDQAFEALRASKAFSKQDVTDLLSRTAAVAASGTYEPFKTTTQFDATARNVEWLG